MILIAIVQRKLSSEFNPPYWCSSLQYQKGLLQSICYLHGSKQREKQQRHGISVKRAVLVGFFSNP